MANIIWPSDIENIGQGYWFIQQDSGQSQDVLLTWICHYMHILHKLESSDNDEQTDRQAKVLMNEQWQYPPWVNMAKG